MKSFAIDRHGRRYGIFSGTHSAPGRPYPPSPLVLLVNAALLQAAERQEIVLRPDLPACEVWYTPASTNPHVD